MKLQYHILYILILLFTANNLFAIDAIDAKESSLIDSTLERAFEILKIDSEELDYTINKKPDSFRLNLIDYLLKNPLESITYTDSLANKLANPKLTYTEQLGIIISILDKEPRYYYVSNPYKKSFKKTSDSLLNLSITEFIEAANKSELLLRGAFIELNTQQLDSLREDGSNLLQMDLSDNDSDDLFALRYAEKESEKRMNNLLSIASKINRQHLYNSGLRFMIASEKILEYLMQIDKETLENKSKYINKDEVSGDVLYLETYTDERGIKRRIVIGGYGTTTYHTDFDLIIDLGGDDFYLNRAGSSYLIADSTDQLGNYLYRSALCIDLSGNDTYRYEGNYAFGCGYFGNGILIDIEGNDLYNIAYYPFSAGLLRKVRAMDKKGDDN